jgi:hypothetical protein
MPHRCVCVFSLRQKSPSWSWGDEPWISRGVLSHRALDLPANKWNLSGKPQDYKHINISSPLPFPSDSQSLSLAIHSSSHRSRHPWLLRMGTSFRCRSTTCRMLVTSSTRWCWCQATSQWRLPLGRDAVMRFGKPSVFSASFHTTPQEIL